MTTVRLIFASGEHVEATGNLYEALGSLVVDRPDDPDGPDYLSTAGLERLPDDPDGAMVFREIG